MVYQAACKQSQTTPFDPEGKRDMLVYDVDWHVKQELDVKGNEQVTAARVNSSVAVGDRFKQPMLFKLTVTS